MRVIDRFTKLGVMENACLFLFKGNGSLVFQERQQPSSKTGSSKTGTATGSGAVRYRAAEGARTNYCDNPSLETNATNWSAVGSGASVARITTDGSAGTACLQLTASGSGTYQGAKYISGTPVKFASSTQDITISLDAKLVSGNGLCEMEVFSLTAGSASIGSSHTFSPFTVTSSWARYSFTFTPRAGAHCFSLILWHQPASASVINIDALVIELGNVANPTYFDGSIGAWLDPITGILGTAHASPSVSQAAAWVEEGTTNLAIDPIFGNATITTGWLASGAGALSRDTTFARIGPASGKLAATGIATDGIFCVATAAVTAQTWTVSGYVRANAAGDVGKLVRPALHELTSLDAGVLLNIGTAIALTDAPQYFSYTVTLSGGGTTAKVRGGLLNGVAAVVTTWNLLEMNLEQKAYATSLCAGAIGTGYAWTGTANASSSTRTKMTVSCDEVNRANSFKGAMFCCHKYDVLVGTGGWVFSVGPWAGASRDQIGIRLNSTPRMGVIETANGTSVADLGGTVTSPAVVGTLYRTYLDWNATKMRIGTNADALTVLTRGVPIGNLTDDDLYIGSSGAILGVGGQVNGSIGPFAIYDSPLTAAELAKVTALASAGALAWNSIKRAA